MSQEYLKFTSELIGYVHRNGIRQHPAQKALHEETQKHPQGNMQSAPEVTALIELLIKITGATRVMEIGTFTGYTTLGMALSVPEKGLVITCEKSADIFRIGEPFWKQADVHDKIAVQVGDALDSMENYDEGSFDLIFIDADKRRYQEYYEKSLSLLRPGGLVLLDNILWKGKITDAHSDDKRVHDLRALNNFIHKDIRVNMCLIPISDGLTIVRKK